MKPQNVGYMRDVWGSYVWLRVVLVADALERVFLGASLAHFEEAGAPVRGQGQLLQHDVLGHANFLPQIHFSIWTDVDKHTGQLWAGGIFCFRT